jgi:predicted dehydrogenase
VLYCRGRLLEGAFGRVVYSEAEYYHDWDHGLYDVMKWRGGDNWRWTAGGPPMHYPTHSTSQIISVTGAHMTHVSGQGVVDQHEDGLYPDNKWANPFSNETALFRMSDGSSCRINEFRRIGHPGAVRMSMWGTQAGFESNVAGSVWLTKDRDQTTSLDALLECSGVAAAGPPADTDSMDRVTSDDGTHRGAAQIHPVARLPREFLGLANGHSGSHQFLVDDFVRACHSRQLPPNDVWAAARYTIPGIVAHESAMRQGELLEVPDLGDPPTSRQPLYPPPPSEICP